jgi:uncharacterized membrane protein
VELVRSEPARAGSVFGFGLGGLVDGVVLHQILQWHHLVADDMTTTTVEGLEQNTLADGLFHAGTVAVLLIGVVLLWNAAKRPGPDWDRLAIGGVLTGFGAFHIVDEIVFHALLDLHHIRMVDDYLVYDLAFAAIGVALVAGGTALIRRRGPER